MAEFEYNASGEKDPKEKGSDSMDWRTVRLLLTGGDVGPIIGEK